MSLWDWIKGNKGNPGFIEYTIGEYMIRMTIDLTAVKTKDDFKLIFEEFAKRARDEYWRQGRQAPGEDIYIIKRCRVSESVDALLKKVTGEEKQ